MHLPKYDQYLTYNVGGNIFKRVNTKTTVIHTKNDSYNFSVVNFKSLKCYHSFQIIFANVSTLPASICRKFRFGPSSCP